MLFEHSGYFWPLAAMQIVGILSAVNARTNERCSLSGLAFMGCLILLGAATLGAMAVGAEWLLCGVTLGIMTVSAVIDTGRAREEAVI
jgi:hypothetical protein